MTKTPTSLLERLRQPCEPEAWGRFVSLYTPLIYCWARHAGLQDQDAADLVQEVLTTLFRVLPTFVYDRKKGFRRWLKTVTLNTWRNNCKRWDRRGLMRQDDDLNQIAGRDDLEEFWEGEYRQHLATRALKVMQADFQETTWRACWEMVALGRPAADVAAELKLSIGAVYAAKFRVMDRLRQELGGMLE
jgi:RNA polymerase sigma-70 factor (ECF subfamily)